MKTANRLNLAVVALAICTVFTATVQAQDYTYITNNGTITIMGYIGPGGDVTIPSRINVLPVISIGDFAFYFCTSLTSGASFGVLTYQFGFNMNWADDRIVVVEACTNLVNPAWIPLRTNTLTGGSSYFSDAKWTNYPRRFYRLRSP